MAQAVTLNYMTDEHMINLMKKALESWQCPPCKEPEPEIKLFYTREETAKLLKVSLSTLHNHRKEGILMPMKAKGRVLYSRESIMDFVRMSA